MSIDKNKNIQILLTVPKVLVEEIEKHWHDNSVSNRSETIRRLIKKGLESK